MVKTKSGQSGQSREGERGPFCSLGSQSERNINFNQPRPQGRPSHLFAREKPWGQG